MGRPSYNAKDGQFYRSTIKSVVPTMLEIQGAVLGFSAAANLDPRRGAIPSSAR